MSQHIRAEIRQNMLKSCNFYKLGQHNQPQKILNAELSAS